MKKFMFLILVVLSLFSSCEFYNDIFNKEIPQAEEPNEPTEESQDVQPTYVGMFDEYKIDEDTLKSANLPIVYIQTEDNKIIENKKDWISATMKITNCSDEDWNFDETKIYVKGRGNTTWCQVKKPFNIKFDKKQKIFNMPKGKRWMFIANYLDNSFLKNVTAFKIANQLNMAYTVRGEYVNVIFNGNYIGMYWLGEGIKVDKNRVNIDDEKDYLIEMDNNMDEPWKFKSDIKQLPYMIKNDDTMTDEKLNTLKNDINEMESILYSDNLTFEECSSHLDIHSFAQYYLVNEMMYNHELLNPKSCYFTFNSTTKVLSTTTVWDFDWSAYSSEPNLILNNSIYYDVLFKFDEFKNELNSLLDSLSISDLFEYMDETREKIYPSVILDGERWGNFHRNPVGDIKNGFDDYIQYLKNCVGNRISYYKEHKF